jgi:protein TonB
MQGSFFLWTMDDRPWSIEKNPVLLWNLPIIFSLKTHMDFFFAENHSSKPTIMEKSSILSADILDILFEDRNKSYGAYDLRKTYNKRIARSVAGTFLLCLLFIVGTILANGKKKGLNNEIVTTVNLQSFAQEEPKPELPKPIPKDEPKPEMAKATPPLIVPDPDVKEDDIVPDVDKLENAKIGTANTPGDKEDGTVVAAPVETVSANVAPIKPEEDWEKVFPTVQIQAQFPTGVEGWRKYLERSLNKDLPSDNGAAAGDYTVVVSFIVDKNGVISDVKAETDPGYGTAAEAIKVIRKGPNWIPAMQNGHKVIYRQKQNITFRVSAD